MDEKVGLCQKMSCKCSLEGRGELPRAVLIEVQTSQISELGDDGQGVESQRSAKASKEEGLRSENKER